MKIFKQKQAPKGFSLIELIIYIAVLAIILLGMMSFSIDLLELRSKNIVASEIEAQGRLILEHLETVARHSEGVNTGSSTFGTDPGVLSLDVVAAIDDPTVFSLSADDGTFQMKKGSEDTAQLTSSSVFVSELVFTDLTSVEELGIIQVNFTLQYVNEENARFFEFIQPFQATLRGPLD